ncbi:unnamed protein product, partial [Polarella glacialis]
ETQAHCARSTPPILLRNFGAACEQTAFATTTPTTTSATTAPATATATTTATAATTATTTPPMLLHGAERGGHREAWAPSRCQKCGLAVQVPATRRLSWRQKSPSAWQRNSLQPRAAFAGLSVGTCLAADARSRRHRSRRQRDVAAERREALASDSRRSPLLPDGSWPAPTEQELAALSAALPAESAAAMEESVPVLGPSDFSDLDRTRPVRLRGLTDSWPLRQMLTAGSDNNKNNLGFEQLLRSELGELHFRLRPSATLHEYGYAGPAESRITLRQYFAPGGCPPARGVIFENDFHQAMPALGKAYSVPQLLSDVHGKPLFSAGRRHTGIGFHRHNESWLAQLHGRKVWFLVPEGLDRPPALPPWWYLRERPQGMLTCILEPGEVLFVPGGWWHSTWNIDERSFALGWEGDGGDEPSCPAMHAIL